MNKNNFPQEKLRKIAWEVGSKYPVPLDDNHLTFSMIHPRLGYLQWQTQYSSIEPLKALYRERFNNARMVLRIYDITDIVFNGFNAHMFFDLDVTHRLGGNYYFGIPQLARNYMAEIGFRFKDNYFHYLARSNIVYFDQDKSSGDYQLNGLFVSGYRKKKVFPVENIFNAPIYEQLNQELNKKKRKEALSIAIVLLGFNRETGFDSPLGSFINDTANHFKRLGAKIKLFSSPYPHPQGEDLLQTIKDISKKIFNQLAAFHKKNPFHLIHCHDWYSSLIGIEANKRLDIPMTLTLHSTEYERNQSGKMDCFSQKICEWEKRAIDSASQIIVPNSNTHYQVMNMYKAPSEKVIVIPDLLVEKSSIDIKNVGEIRHLFGLDPNIPLMLFTGELSQTTGADILMNAISHICQQNIKVQFVIIGTGPLKGELEGKAHHSNVGHHCRFLGDLSKDMFEDLLIASNFVVIPARVRQDEGLAQLAIGHGKPVLTTHQARISCVIHGENGLITYDNPGSIIWGIQELLHNQLNLKMNSQIIKRAASEGYSMESIAVQHCVCYERLLSEQQLP
ncbi:MAG: DUF4912 domain-containing protein [bacterium]